MLLTELFDSSVPYTLDGYGNGHFVINDKQYNVEFSTMESPSIVEVSFTLQKDQYEVPHYVWGVEGTGDELSVFSTVIAIIREYISNKNISQLTFTAKTTESSRVKLYDRMVTNMSKGWAVKSRLVSGEKIYTLTNPNFNTTPTQSSTNLDDVPF